MERKNTSIYLLLLACLFSANTWGQASPDSYDTKWADLYNKGNTFYTDKIKIQHKPAKWYDLRKKLNVGEGSDNFSSNWYTTITPPEGEDIQIQAAHTLVDTIYMHRGQTVELHIPDRNYSGAAYSRFSVRSYQRWYNYQTDGATFKVGKKDSTLLSPAAPFPSYVVRPVRMENGYVGFPLTNDIFDTTKQPQNMYPLINMKFFYPEDGAAEYQVACDVSSYTDFTKEYRYDPDTKKSTSPDSAFIRIVDNDTICYEPTLSHRILYVIRDIDNTDDWRNQVLNKQKNNQGEGADDFMETYEISMPLIRYKDYSDEMVALTADARSYVVPGEKTPGKLDVTINNSTNTAGIQLTTDNLQLSDEQRVISFKYPEKFTFNNSTYGDGYIWKVKTDKVANPSATIEVTKTVDGFTYRLVKFKLNFTAATTLLSQTVLEQLEDPNTDVSKTPWGAYRYRTNAFLSENFELVTDLNFDYDTQWTENYGVNDIYPFPLSWSSGSYAFHDGSLNITSPNNKPDFIRSLSDYPDNGYYSITSYEYYKATKIQKNSKGKASTHHIFLDASDRPGRIVQLRFDKNLCPGSELFVTAWVKTSKDFGNPKLDNGAMLFTIIGVDASDPNNPVYTPIYRHQTGQIPSANQLAPGVTVNHPEQLPGFKENDWMQLYFSFINTLGSQPYDHYVLQIDNNSPSTNGSDLFLDDIRVYMAKPQGQILQKSYGCKDDKPLLRMSVSWDRLLSRSGLKEGTNKDEGKEEHISFCFVDSVKYHEALATAGSDDKKKKAFEDAIVNLSYPMVDGTSSETDKYGKLLYNTYFNSDKNEEYDMDINTVNKQVKFKEEDGQAATRLFRMEDTGVERSLAADIYAKLKPFHTYYLVLESPHDKDPGTTPVPEVDRFSDFYGNDDHSCSAYTTFQIESEGAIMINGELAKPDSKYCAGTVLNFGVQLQADLDGEGEKPVESEVFYDWFLGTENEYNEDNGNSISVSSSLEAFRIDYPKVTDLEDWEPKDQNMKQLLQKQVEDKKLMLNRSHLNFHLPENGLQMMVRVIPKSVTTDEDKALLICADPMEIQLKAEGDSPQASIGFNDVTYPDATDKPDLSYHPVVRIGKAQIDRITDANNQLKLPLRNVFINTEGNQLKKADHPYIYLIASNDPELQSVFHREEGFKNTDWPVGTIDEFQATKDGEGNNYLTFHFGKPTDLTDETIPKVDFREGFWYTLEVNFVETGAAKETNNCDGNLIFDLKVVPEYQKWIGAANGNWNNDANWQRSSADELHKTDAAATTYDEGYTNPDLILGFVPMSFTKVTVPESKQLQLYKPTDKTPVTPTSNDSHIIWNLSTNEVSDNATPNIEYDLMVKATTAATNDASTGSVAFDCETYYTNTVDQIHFEPAAEMLHAEYLNYQKAWVDYELTDKQWYTLASPLQGVVAGDWYTLSTTAHQTTEYFKGITFNTTDYSRFQPSVYQRGWKGSLVSIKKVNETDVAVAGNWSGVYNKVDESYMPGTGFSVKVLDLPNDANNSALFRFPKEDEKYSYYANKEDQSGEKETDITRTNPGLLKSNELKSNESFKVSLEAQNGTSDYYLIGNPFIAHLNTEEFFKANNNLQKKFWLVTKDNQSAAVGITDNAWITTETAKAGTGTPTIAPLQSFFVEKTADNSTNTVTFNADMQVLGSTDAESKSSSVSFVSSVSTPVLTLTATTADGRQSRAAIAYDPAALDEYKANEDAELFLDSNLSKIPAIYTVAGTMAASINRTPALWNIPVGIYGTGNSSETVALSFENLDLFPGTTLYDAEKKTETVLHGNSIFTVPANTCGRYFLRAGTPTGNERVEAGAIRIYTIAHRQLIVASTENLQTVAIYDFAGRLLRYSENLSGYLFTTYLDKGNYIVKATSEHQQQTSKIQIR